VQVLRRTARSAERWTRVATAGQRSLPDFLVIGAQKAGTTSLYHYLTQFGDVRSASTKEVHYFDHHYELGERWYRSRFPVLRVGRAWITGEATPSYLLHPAVPGRVAALVPDVRLVALLRHPVERAYSHFQHSRARGTEPVQDFERALDMEPERTDDAWTRLERAGSRQRDVETFSYVRRSRYMPQLRRWLDVFPASSLLLVTAEELSSAPGEVLDRVRRHLGLPPTSERIALDRRNARSYEQMPDRLRRRLAHLFAPDVAEVERLLGRPTGWEL
jgi:hypothetical protein